MTPPPETQAQSETLERIAERIAHEFYDVATVDPDLVRSLQNAVLSALRNERERACRLLCPFCGHDDYNLIFHHEEWRH